MGTRFAGLYLRFSFAAILIVAAVLLLLAGHGQPAKAAGEQMLFVDPPLRTISQCRLTAVRQSVLLCTSPGGGARVVRLSPDVVVWKGLDRRGTASLKLGDVLDIKLAAAPRDGRELGTFIWANLAKREGAVRNWARSGFQLGSTKVLVDGRTQYLGNRQRGASAIVIGLQVDPDTVRATRVLFAGR